MRRALRHLFTILSALPLLLCVAIWGRSYFRVDGVSYQPRIDNVLHLYEVSWGRGELTIGMEAAERTATSRLFWWSYVPNPGVVSAPAPDAFHFLGVRLINRIESVSTNDTPDRWPRVREMGVILPCWLAALLSACLPADWLLRRRRQEIVQQRLERGQCVRCGYDLRASPERCPECGTPYPHAG